MPTLGASKHQERFYVILVGRLEGVNIAAPKVPLGHDVCAAPCEYGPFLRPHQYIGHESCMATVAVGEEMDGNQTMMEADGDLIGRKGLVFEPIAGVAQQDAK